MEDQLDQMADCSNLNKAALRLLSPIEATRWRQRFKRRHPNSTSQSPKRSPLKLVRRRSHTHPSKCWQKKGDFTMLIMLINMTFLLLFAALAKGRSTPNSAQLTPSLPNRKTDFYNQLGIVTLQQRLLILLKDFLCLLPDSAVDEVLRHYVKLEFLLVLANQRSCAVRTAIVQLLTVLTKRLPTAELIAASKQLYPLHLANQLTIHGTDVAMFEACLSWVTDLHASLNDVFNNEETLGIRQRFGLQSLLAISMALGNSSWNTEPQRVFRALLRLYLQVGL